MCGGDHRVAAAGNVAADACDRHVAVPKLHAGQRLDFDVDDRGALRLGEAADLRLGEADVFDHLFRQTSDQGVDLGLRQPKRLRRPIVEPLRQFPDGRVAALADVGQDCLYGLSHFAVCIGRGFGRNPRLDVTDHYWVSIHSAVQPPSTSNAEPVTSDEASEAR